MKNARRWGRAFERNVAASVMAAVMANVMPDVPRGVTVHDRLRPHLFRARVDAEDAVDAAGDAADNGADNGADGAGHPVALMEAVSGAGGNALRLRGERQRREARCGDDEYELQGRRPHHERERRHQAMTDRPLSPRIGALAWRNCAGPRGSPNGVGNKVQQAQRVTAAAGGAPCPRYVLMLHIAS